MGFFEGLVAKAIGKRIDQNLDKWHISKAKVIAWVAFAVTITPQVSALLGHPVQVPDEVLKLLAALGLWALKDGQNPVDQTTKTEEVKNETPK